MNWRKRCTDAAMAAARTKERARSSEWRAAAGRAQALLNAAAMSTDRHGALKMLEGTNNALLRKVVDDLQYMED